jgi:hypothetical protein
MGKGFVSKPGSKDGEFTRDLKQAQVFDSMSEAFSARTGLQRVLSLDMLNKDKK